MNADNLPAVSEPFGSNLDEVKRAAKCVYLATEASVADDLSRILNWCVSEIEGWPELGVIEVMIRNPAVDEFVREKEAEIERLHTALRKLREPPTMAADAETVSAVMDLHELQCVIIDEVLP
mgnify:CR=1 FL=1